MPWDLLGALALLFGGGWLALRIGRAALHRFAPARMVGPDGLLIDTRNGLGLLQMGTGAEPGGHGQPDSSTGGRGCD